MGTFNANLYPAQTGLALGNSNQLWIGYLSNAFTQTVQSLTGSTALTGFIRLASTDSIAWRNNANSADVALSKTGAAVTTTPADTLVFGGSGIEGPFISSAGNPASAGQLRLAGSDIIYFRNNANNNDVVGIQHNSDDTITVGGAAGAKVSGPITATGVVSAASFQVTTATASSLIATGNGTQLSLQSASGTSGSTAGGLMSLTAGNGIGTATGGALTLTSGNGGGTNGNGADITLTAGSSGGGVGSGGSISLNAGTGNVNGALLTNAKFLTYGGVTVAGQGVIPEVAIANFTGQTAAITTTTLFPVVTAGQYRLSWNAKVTTAAGTSSTLGALTITYTDPDGVVQTITAGAQTSAGAIATTSAGNSTTTVLLGVPMLLNCKAATNIQYAMAYASNAANAMAYNLHLALEAM